MEHTMLTPDFQLVDQRFLTVAYGNVHLEKLASECRWTEGPAYFPAGRYLVWSDLPNDRTLRWDETDGSVSVFQHSSNFANGHTVDREGRLICCEHFTRCVSRIEIDGSRTVLASHYQGKRLNSPNDVVVKSDGSVWFTDPSYGIDSEYEGGVVPSEIGACNVYHLDPASGVVSVVADDFARPNGLAFSPDESLLYIVDSGATHAPDGPRHIRRFRVTSGGRGLTGGEVFAACDSGIFDGLRLDIHGNVWTSAGDGVRCYAPDGALLGRIVVPEVVANVCFGGIKRNRLFICATTSLYAIYVNTQGALRP